MDEDLEKDAERRLELATAKLGVAEQYRFIVGVGVGLFVHLLVANSWIAFAAFCVAFWFAASSYEKEYEAANEAFDRITGTGEYYKTDREKPGSR